MTTSLSTLTADMFLPISPHPPTAAISTLMRQANHGRVLNVISPRFHFEASESEAFRVPSRTRSINYDFKRVLEVGENVLYVPKV